MVVASDYGLLPIIITQSDRTELDDRQVRRTLAEPSRRLSGLTPAMQDVGQALVEAIRTHGSSPRVRGTPPHTGRT